jgi:Plasmid pRiA4b ORF-3-like protein
MSRSQEPEQSYPVKLSLTQRKVMAECVPEVAERLKLDEKDQRTIQFTSAELNAILLKAAAAVRHARGMTRKSLRNVTILVAQAIDRSQGIGAIPVSERLYQFKITLDAQPAIWRRIQVRDCTLDKLHKHIQTAMGWTNSHLHKFRIAGMDFGDPDLLSDDMEDYVFEDSTSTKIGEILPKTGERFGFEYEYDFGDGWKHEVAFEGCVRAEPGGRYPVCVEGARACPPEDVGGVWGYKEYQEAMADLDHERHKEYMGWRGRFDPEAFDAETATKRMRRGLPN